MFAEFIRLLNSFRRSLTGVAVISGALLVAIPFATPQAFAQAPSGSRLSPIIGDDSVAARRQRQNELLQLKQRERARIQLQQQQLQNERESARRLQPNTLRQQLDSERQQRLQRQQMDDEQANRTRQLQLQQQQNERARALQQQQLIIPRQQQPQRACGAFGQPQCLR